MKLETSKKRELRGRKSSAEWGVKEALRIIASPRPRKLESAGEIALIAIHFVLGARESKDGFISKEDANGAISTLVETGMLTECGIQLRLSVIDDKRIGWWIGYAEVG